MAAKVTINRAALNKLLGPTGPMDAFARAKAVKTAQIARGLIHSRSGKLASSIRVTPGRRPNWNVIADTPYARFVHDGTKPHDIGSPVLIDNVGWRYIGRSPAGRGKPHPGTKRQPFLVEAARRAGLVVRTGGGRSRG
jgi:hypothetical protein